MNRAEMPFSTKSSLPRTLSLLLLAAAAAAAIAGCDAIGLSAGGPTGPSARPERGTSFGGYFVGEITSGHVWFYLPRNHFAGALSRHDPQRMGAGVISARGSLAALGDSSVPLLGTYNEERDSLYLEGGGYTLIGRYGSSKSFMKGTISTPAGRSGTFRCLEGAGLSWCGAYASASGSTLGSLIVATNGFNLIGVAVPTGAPSDDAIEFDGTEYDTNVGLRIEFAGGVPGVLALTGTGTLPFPYNTMSGEWALDDVANLKDDAGTWSAVPCH